MSKMDFLLIDLLLAGIAIAALPLIGTGVVMVLLTLIAVPYFRLPGKRHLLAPFLIALAMASIWAWIAGDMYRYRESLLLLGQVNLYPVLFWLFGLFVNMTLYDDLMRYLHRHPIWVHLAVFSLMFWAGLLFVEVMAYHVYGVRNLATLGYPGLPGCDCIHGPRWMQTSYLASGPVYFIAITLLGYHQNHPHWPPVRCRLFPGLNRRNL
ncbi:MAG: hypothetical protein A2286_12460 [Gammaproteobacteria bacterium RIFOXYA12_FULL_61_12]|nr:MAG: hypothetical protein A2514_15660 [Gammaproteobacteria bacterium RIFOXYD12_FULL_61_37]OGT94303.1 MAG: hypothetical protein A2286_12460 [Gammaproteobacteria bacterium RIFOXYA12_FULL_61_12]